VFRYIWHWSKVAQARLFRDLCSDSERYLYTTNDALKDKLSRYLQPPSNKLRDVSQNVPKWMETAREESYWLLPRVPDIPSQNNLVPFHIEASLVLQI